MRFPGRASEKLRGEMDSWWERKCLTTGYLPVLGRGGMGMVYSAEDLRLGRLVALKFLPPEVGNDPGALKRFEREAQLTSALNHPNICTIHEIGEHQGQPFIAMELLEGETLRRRLDTSESKRLSLPELLDLSSQVCDALQAAHEKGIIHRDIKPGQYLSDDARHGQSIGLGIAKLVAHETGSPDGTTEPVGGSEGSLRNGKPSTLSGDNTSLTATGAFVGTAAYMSPEQVRKENLDNRSDLFSFGATLYEAATGCRAFGGLTDESIREAILHGSPSSAHVLNPEIPVRLDDIISRTLEKDRERRFQSAEAIGQEIEAIRARIRPPKTARWAWVGGAAAAILLIAWRSGLRWAGTAARSFHREIRSFFRS